MTAVSGRTTESYQERFNRRLYYPGAFTMAHTRLPERVRMWSPWWLRHVVAVERTSHDRTAESLRAAWKRPPDPATRDLIRRLADALEEWLDAFQPLARTLVERRKRALIEEARRV